MSNENGNEIWTRFIIILYKLKLISRDYASELLVNRVTSENSVRFQNLYKKYKKFKKDK